MRVIKLFLPEDFIVIYNEYLNQGRLSVNILASHYSVSPSVVHRWLQECGLQIEKTNDKKEKSFDLESFKRDVEDNKSLNNICEKYNLTSRNVKNICKRNNIKVNNWNRDNGFDVEAIIDSVRLNGKQKTARDFNTTIQKINGILKRANVSVEKYHGLKRHDLDTCTPEIIEMYNAGHSISKISTHFKSNNKKIREILENSGIDVQTRFDAWKKQKEEVNSKIGTFVEDNVAGLNLIEISAKYEVSYEVLKESFKNNNIDVSIHASNKSKGELDLKDFIKSLGFSCESVKRLHNNKRYEIDCFIPEKNVGIEYCGEFWHSANKGTEKKYHQDKLKWCMDQGITLITLFENEWYRKNDLIKNMIKNRLGLSTTRIHGRKTVVKEVANSVSKDFHDTNHINGGLNASSINLGLFFKEELVSVASFSKSRYSKECEYELLRFSTVQDAVVVGGFSKIFKEFLKMTSTSSVVSFCDLRFGVGNVYTKSGFTMKEMTAPNYWYFKKKDGVEGKLLSRIRYQKHKLTNFIGYSADKSEYQIMAENGYLKIYDCGNYKYVWGE